MKASGEVEYFTFDSKHAKLTSRVGSGSTQAIDMSGLRRSKQELCYRRNASRMTGQIWHITNKLGQGVVCDKREDAVPTSFNSARADKPTTFQPSAFHEIESCLVSRLDSNVDLIIAIVYLHSSHCQPTTFRVRNCFVARYAVFVESGESTAAHCSPNLSATSPQNHFVINNKIHLHLSTSTKIILCGDLVNGKSVACSSFCMAIASLVPPVTKWMHPYHVFVDLWGAT